MSAGTTYKFEIWRDSYSVGTKYGTYNGISYTNFTWTSSNNWLSGTQNASYAIYGDLIDENEYERNVEVIELTSTGDVSIIDAELYTGDCATNPCASFDRYQYCIIDSVDDCILKFQYNNNIDPSTVYLIENGRTWAYNNAVASSSIYTSEGGIYNQLILPKPAESTSTEYYLLFDIDGYGDYVIGKARIEYVLKTEIATTTTEEWKDSLEMEECNCDNITPAEDTFDYFRYGIECGTRKSVCWLFYPTSYGNLMLKETIETAKLQFPLSMANQIWYIFNEQAESTSSDRIMVPLKWWDNTTKTYKETGVNLLSSTTLANSLNIPITIDEEETTLYDFYYTWFGYLLKLCAFGYILFRLFQFLTPDKVWLQAKRERKTDKKGENL